MAWRLLVLAALLVPLVGDSGPAAPGEPYLDFIHFTDTHVMDDAAVAMPIALARMQFSEAGERLTAFLASTRRRPPAFFLVTGDLIDAYRIEGADGRPVHGQVEAFLRAAAASPAPLYLALGNHDRYEYSIAEGTVAVRLAEEEAQAAWTARAKCFRGGPYYSFRRRVGRAEYLFLVLDSGAGEEPISPRQARWIRTALANRRGAHAILAMHFPLLDDAVSRSIREAAAGGGVVLALAGHLHSNAIRTVAIGPDTAVQVRTAALAYGDGNWRRIRLREDRIEVFATGDTERVERVVRAERPLTRAAP